MFSKILTKPFLVTVLRYGLNAVGVWLAANQGFDPGAWETISGALLVIATTLMGATESVKDKVTQDGKTVETSKLPAGTQNAIQAAVENKKGRTVIDMLFGK